MAFSPKTSAQTLGFGDCKPAPPDYRGTLTVAAVLTPRHLPQCFRLMLGVRRVERPRSPLLAARLSFIKVMSERLSGRQR